MKKYTPTDENIDDHINRIKQSIKDDVGTVLPVYASVPSGFFAVPRLLFPEIDGMGSFLTGIPKKTTLNIVTFFRIVSSKIDSRYGKYAVFIALVYRHGLLHQHAPKVFEYRKKDIGWIFSMNHPNDPITVQREYHLNFIGHNLQLNMNVFYEDVLSSIEILRDMVKGDYRQSFIEATAKQTVPLNKTLVLRKDGYKKFVKKDDFEFFKEKTE